MTLDTQFDKAVTIVRGLPSDGPVKPSQDQKLQFYGAFKQATEGDVTGPRPGAFSFEAKYKYDAWKKLEGKSKDDAKAEYVALLKSVLEANSDDDSKKYLAELEAAA
ncbi:Acyl-CoA-binding 3 [Vanrija pseudolonga]|uniref:Acyl-CoA-binding 3 n=1 Tax=Vanrija pseudolonga TaxID=143232 RepID=A0AAF0Y6F2_9TREE|nr:Acyl-CoA-binding 3 [Vanrija pseudolonga]